MARSDRGSEANRTIRGQRRPRTGLRATGFSDVVVANIRPRCSDRLDGAAPRFGLRGLEPSDHLCGWVEDLSVGADPSGRLPPMGAAHRPGCDEPACHQHARLAVGRDHAPAVGELARPRDQICDPDVPPPASRSSFRVGLDRREVPAGTSEDRDAISSGGEVAEREGCALSAAYRGAARRGLARAPHERCTTRRWTAPSAICAADLERTSSSRTTEVPTFRLASDGVNLALRWSTPSVAKRQQVLKSISTRSERDRRGRRARYLHGGAGLGLLRIGLGERLHDDDRVGRAVHGGDPPGLNLNPRGRDDARSAALFGRGPVTMSSEGERRFASRSRRGPTATKARINEDNFLVADLHSLAISGDDPDRGPKVVFAIFICDGRRRCGRGRQRPSRVVCQFAVTATVTQTRMTRDDFGGAGSGDHRATSAFTGRGLGQPVAPVWGRRLTAAALVDNGHAVFARVGAPAPTSFGGESLPQITRPVARRQNWSSAEASPRDVANFEHGNIILSKRSSPTVVVELTTTSSSRVAIADFLCSGRASRHGARRGDRGSSPLAAIPAPPASRSSSGRGARRTTRQCDHDSSPFDGEGFRDVVGDVVVDARRRDRFVPDPRSQESRRAARRAGGKRDGRPRRGSSARPRPRVPSRTSPEQTSPSCLRPPQFPLDDGRGLRADLHERELVARATSASIVCGGVSVIVLPPSVRARVRLGQLFRRSSIIAPPCSLAARCSRSRSSSWCTRRPKDDHREDGRGQRAFADVGGPGDVGCACSGPATVSSAPPPRRRVLEVLSRRSGRWRANCPAAVTRDVPTSRRSGDDE